MGMIKRSSATSLIGWLILAVALLSAISVTAYAMTRSGAAKPPQRSLASAVHRIFTARPVTGVRRRLDQPQLPFVQSVVGPDRLDDALSDCDVLVIAAAFVASIRGFMLPE